MEFDADWRQAVADERVNIGKAIVTFGPLILAWLLVYVLVWLTQWVRGGFRQA